MDGVDLLVLVLNHHLDPSGHRAVITGYLIRLLLGIVRRTDLTVVSLLREVLITLDDFRPIEELVLRVCHVLYRDAIECQQQGIAVTFELGQQGVLDIVVRIGEGRTHVRTYLTLQTDNEEPWFTIRVPTALHHLHRAVQELRSKRRIGQRVDRLDGIRQTVVQVLYGTDIDIVHLARMTMIHFGLDTLVQRKGVRRTMLGVIGRLDRNTDLIHRARIHQHAGENTGRGTGIGSHRHAGTRSVADLHIQTELEFHLGRVAVFVRRSGFHIRRTVRSGRITQHIQQHDIGSRRSDEIFSLRSVTHHVRTERLTLDIIALVFHGQIQRTQRTLAGFHERYIVHLEVKYSLAVLVHLHRLDLRILRVMQAVIDLQHTVLDTHFLMLRARRVVVEVIVLMRRRTVTIGTRVEYRIAEQISDILVGLIYFCQGHLRFRVVDRLTFYRLFAVVIYLHAVLELLATDLNRAMVGEAIDRISGHLVVLMREAHRIHRFCQQIKRLTRLTLGIQRRIPLRCGLRDLVFHRPEVRAVLTRRLIRTDDDAFLRIDDTRRTGHEGIVRRNR